MVKSICSCILEQPCLRSHLSGMGSLVFTCVPCDTYLFDLSVTSPGLTVSHYADCLTYQSHLQTLLFHITLTDQSVTSPGLTVSHHAVLPTSPGLTVSHYADRLTYQSHLQAWLFHITLTVWIKMMADGWKNRFSD